MWLNRYDEKFSSANYVINESNSSSSPLLGPTQECRHFSVGWTLSSAHASSIIKAQIGDLTTLYYNLSNPMVQSSSLTQLQPVPPWLVLLI